MQSPRKLGLLLFLLLLTGSVTSIVVATAWLPDENTTIEILGYNLYKFEGSGHYAVFYPLPNGSVKLLKTGKVGLLPTLIKIPREEWLRAFSAENNNVLRTQPVPLMIFVNDKGLGFATLRGSKVVLQPLEVPNKPTVMTAKPCPKGYVPEGPRYCVPNDIPTNWVEVLESKTITEPISFIGIRVENNVLKELDFETWLFLNRATYSYWTVGLNVGPVTVYTKKLGEHFEGKGIDIGYRTPDDVRPEGSIWSRYVNLYVKYQVVVFGVLAYDRYTGKFTKLPVMATYPLEILSEGRYTVEETSNGPKFVERTKGLWSPFISSDPYYYHVPDSSQVQRIWLFSGRRKTIVYMRGHSSWRFTSESSLSVPIGPRIARALQETGLISRYPNLAKVLNSISLTFGFHYYSGEQSGFLYSIKGIPKRDCYALVYMMKVNTTDYRHVDVPMLLVTVTDGKSSGICDPKTELCIDSADKS
ncbi:hypothetical protein [Thermococcus sp. 9N3]|uniref:hypothetical protein n=1 Tax=Thermococcus sp. 9N3 TaxID=163002 RepID=UPI0014306F91|nr:hypothetical protein [Thermococcus sp. 9N3]NJE49585.1 hypothetical protein [Thermococcus sp. 9N3]